MTDTVHSVIATRLAALGIPAQIDTEAYPSIVALFEEALAAFREEAACSSVGHTLTYGELDRLSADFAGWLQNGARLSRGDRVAIQMPNLIQYLVASLGALRAGMVVVNTNPLYTERELEHQLNDANVRVMVVQANVAQTAAAVLPRTQVETVVVTEIADLHPMPKRTLINFIVKHVKKMVPKFHIAGALKFNDVLKRGAKTPYRAVILEQTDLAMLQYTGGTTGVAKGAMLTHGNLIANVLQSDAFLRLTIWTGEARRCCNRCRSTISTRLPPRCTHCGLARIRPSCLIHVISIRWYRPSRRTHPHYFAD